MRRAAKIDSNQNEIVEGLRKCGWTVQILSAVGKGCPDIVVGAKTSDKGAYNFLIEIKDGNKPPSARKLTPDEQKWHTEWKGQVHVINSLEEAIQLIQNS